MRKEFDNAAKHLHDNFLSINFKRAENGYGGWIPRVTVRNNCLTTNLHNIYFAFEVYENQKRLIWDGNVLVDHLKAGASAVREASYDPSRHFIPDSVHNRVEVSKKRFEKD